MNEKQKRNDNIVIGIITGIFLYLLIEYIIVHILY